MLCRRMIIFTGKKVMEYIQVEVEVKVNNDHIRKTKNILRVMFLKRLFIVKPALKFIFIWNK